MLSTYNLIQLLRGSGTSGTGTTPGHSNLRETYRHNDFQHLVNFTQGWRCSYS